ncbi:MgtC/SapB family protein [Sporosarcina sp. CAU 1771]
MEYLGLIYEEQFGQNLEVYARILISALLGMFIGWDRTSKNKPAGLKTFTYVAVSCTLITLVSIYSAEFFGGSNFNNRMDPMRLAAQIVTGLGFLGAGLIMKDGLRVKGLTSAAMIFFAGGVGIGIGAGFYGLVFFTVAVTFILTKISNMIENREKDLKKKKRLKDLKKEVEQINVTE